MNGATAQAEVLGIFGREGLDVAARWTTPKANSPAFLAMKMYRNYDGKKSGFGDVSVKASVEQPDKLAAFAAERGADHVLTVMVINKIGQQTAVTLAVSNFAAAGEVDREHARLYAFDPATGKLLWVNEEALSSYGTPAAMKIGKIDAIVTPTGTVVSASDGKTLATDIGRTAHATPLAAGDGLVFFLAFDAGCFIRFGCHPNSTLYFAPPRQLWQI